MTTKTTAKTLDRPIAKEAAALAMSLGAQAGGDLPTARRTAGEAYRWLCHHDDTYSAEASGDGETLRLAWAKLPQTYRDDPDFDSPSSLPSAVSALAEGLQNALAEVARVTEERQSARRQANERASQAADHADRADRLEAEVVDLIGRSGYASLTAQVQKLDAELQTTRVRLGELQTTHGRVLDARDELLLDLQATRVRLAAAESMVSEWKGRAEATADMGVELGKLQRSLYDTEDHAADQERRADNAEAEVASLLELSTQHADALGKLQRSLGDAEDYSEGQEVRADHAESDIVELEGSLAAALSELAELRNRLAGAPESEVDATAAVELVPVDEPDVTAEDLGVVPMTRTFEMVAEGVLVEFPLSSSELDSLRTAEAQDNAADAEPESSFVGMPSDGPTPAEVEMSLLAVASEVDPFAHLPPDMRAWMRAGR